MTTSSIVVKDISKSGHGPWQVLVNGVGIAQWPCTHDPKEYAEEVARVLRRALGDTGAHPDEPMFVLLGRDPMAGALVMEWVGMRRARGEDEGTLREAEACAAAMDTWCTGLGKYPIGHCSLMLEAEAQDVFRELGIAMERDRAKAKDLGVTVLNDNARGAVRRAIQRAYERGRGESK